MELKERIRHESKIIKILNRDNSNKNTFHFKMENNFPNSPYVLKLLSCNGYTQSVFLIKFLKSRSIKGVYKKMYDYVSKIKQRYNYTWTVEWYEKNNKEVNISYFYGDSEEDVREKFYYSNDKNKKIHSIVKNPIS